MTDMILVGDDDADVLRFVAVSLRLEGYDVVSVDEGAEVLAAAVKAQPDLVLLDAEMSGVDGLELTRRLRADLRTAHLPILLLTARSRPSDTVAGLRAGADDYVLHPVDPTELVARVRTLLRRVDDLRASSPLTGLPGNHRITAELGRRQATGAPLAVIYADLNDFKSYNDRYGFVRGDDVITMTADVLCDALAATTEGGFLGHVGGDDFLALCQPDEVNAFCEQVIADFHMRIGPHYDPADLARGHLELPDRQGELRRFPLVSIALGVATTERRTFTDHRELVAVATEMKAYLKRSGRRSAFAVDGRSNGAPTATVA